MDETEHGAAESHEPVETHAAPAEREAGVSEAVQPELSDVSEHHTHTEQPQVNVLSFFPDLPVRSATGGFGLIVLTVVLVLLAQGAGKLREGLLADGLLPRASSIVQSVLSVLALLAGLGAAGAFVPDAFAWAVPLVVVGAAIAVGFVATRDLLPDILAGITLSVERRVEIGQWISTSEFSGVVEVVGIRSVWIRDVNNRRLAIPNRQLTNTTVANEEARFPALELVIHIPGDHPNRLVRQLLLESVMVSPWIAPGEAPSLVRDAADPTLWRVRARLLEGQFSDRFEGSLRDRVEEALNHISTSTNVSAETTVADPA